MSFIDAIKEEVERTNEQIRQSIPKDQGRAAQSLRVDVVENEVRSIGLDYIEYLDRGSAPWSNPDKFKSLGFILDRSGWGDRHNISPYAAAYSIAHDGSLIWQGKKQGIELDKKLADLQARLKQKLAIFVKTDITNMIRGK